MTDNADYSLILTRTFDAPAAKVYKCWTDPDLMKQWFAPRPFTTPVIEVDLRAGGANRIVMQDEAGNQYPNQGVYLEVVPNRKVVFTDASPQPGSPPQNPSSSAKSILRRRTARRNILP